MSGAIVPQFDPRSTAPIHRSLARVAELIGGWAVVRPSAARSDASPPVWLSVGTIGRRFRCLIGGLGVSRAEVTRWMLDLAVIGSGHPDHTLGSIVGELVTNLLWSVTGSYQSTVRV